MRLGMYETIHSLFLLKGFEMSVIGRPPIRFQGLDIIVEEPRFYCHKFKNPAVPIFSHNVHMVLDAKSDTITLSQRYSPKRSIPATAEDIQKESNAIFNENNCSTLYYLSKN